MSPFECRFLVDAYFHRARRLVRIAALDVTLPLGHQSTGPRAVRFRPHRSKKFDVCGPLTGEPKILISIKSMQNAYRNFTITRGCCGTDFHR